MTDQQQSSAETGEDERELGETQSALRYLSPTTQKAIFVFSVVFALLHIFMNALGAPLLQFADWLGALLGLSFGDNLLRQAVRALALPDPQIKNAIHFAGFALLCAAFYPMVSKKPICDSRGLFILDMLIGLIAALSVLFFVLQESNIYDRGVRLTAVEWAAGRHYGTLVTIRRA